MRPGRLTTLAAASLVACALALPSAGGRTTAIAASPPVVLHASESANPGEVVGLMGAEFGSAPQLWLARVIGDAMPGPQTAPAMLSATDGHAAARIPATEPRGLYAVWVRTDSGFSRRPVWINRARATHLEYDRVAPGTSLRAFGRNLLVPGATPSVRLVDPSTHVAAPAVVDVAHSDAHALRFTVPGGLTTGRAYDVALSNGMGGAHGTVDVPERLTLRPPGHDPYGLGVPWAADFGFSGNVYDVTTDPRLTLHAAADGLSNDQGAIQAAIDRASADGGGEVYLPAATYHIGIGRLTMRSRVVMRGAGVDRTVIADTPVSGIDVDPGSSVVGITDLTVLGPTATQGTNLRMNASPAAPIDRVFLRRVRLRLDVYPSPAIEGNAIHHILVTDSAFDESARQAAPLYWHHASYVTVRNSSFRFLNARIMLGDADHVLWEGNSSTRDYTLPDQPAPNGDSGHLDLQCTSQVAILRSSFRLVGPNRDSGDGETINTQCGSQPDRPRYRGTATSADATHLVDAGQAFDPAAHGGLYAVWILKGPGMGEWRWVVSSAPAALTVDRPWDVVPAAGSVYSVREMDAYQFLIADNTLTKNRFGIEHYTGVQESVIARNTLTDDGPIWLRSQVHREAPVDLSPVWDNVVEENTVSASDHQEYDTAAIGVIDDELSGPLVGAMVLGNEIRRNTIHAQVPNQRFPSCGNVEDGYWAWTRDETNGDDIPGDGATMATVATIFDGNRAYDTTYPYWVDTGTYATVIADDAGVNSGDSPRDMAGAGAGHGSVGTVVSHGGGPVAPATAPASTRPSTARARIGGGFPSRGLGVVAGVSVGIAILWARARRRRRPPAVRG